MLTQKTLESHLRVYRNWWKSIKDMLMTFSLLFVPSQPGSPCPKVLALKHEHSSSQGVEGGMYDNYKWCWPAANL